MKVLQTCAAGEPSLVSSKKDFFPKYSYVRAKEFLLEHNFIFGAIERDIHIWFDYSAFKSPS